MAQKIPFFELFPSLDLTWKQRVALEGAYITFAEVQREKRRMDISLTVHTDLGDEKEGLEHIIAESFALNEVRIQQYIVYIYKTISESVYPRHVGIDRRGPISNFSLGLKGKKGPNCQFKQF